MNYESEIIIRSKVYPEVILVVSLMSFGRRLELMRLVREISLKLEFHLAGQKESDKMESAILSAEIDGLYVRWGLVKVQGLTINGEPATADMLAANGPEELFQEALAFVRDQCGLTEKERKN